MIWAGGCSSSSFRRALLNILQLLIEAMPLGVP
jgi:hypothetical protein